jgi:chaperonin GroES
LTKLSKNDKIITLDGYYLLFFMTLKPLGDHIIVKPLSNEEITKAGIVLPDTVDKDRPERGEVIAVGPGRILDNGSRAPMEVSAGQKVVFKKYSPEEIKIDGQTFLVINLSEVIAIIE